MKIALQIGFFAYALNLLDSNIFAADKFSLGRSLSAPLESAASTAAAIPIAIKPRAHAGSWDAAESKFSVPKSFLLKKYSPDLMGFSKTRLQHPYQFILCVLDILDQDKSFLAEFGLIDIFTELADSAQKDFDGIWLEFHEVGFFAAVKKRIFTMNEEIIRATEVGMLGTSVVCGERMLENQTSILERNAAVIQVIEGFEAKFKE